MPTPRSPGRGAHRSATSAALPSVRLSADLVDAVLLAVPTRPDPAEAGAGQAGPGKAGLADATGAGERGPRAVLLGSAPVAVDLAAEKAKGTPGEVVSVPGTAPYERVLLAGTGAATPADLRAPRPDDLGVGTRPERPGARRRGP